MILIWGFRIRWSKGEPVVFFCPHEGGDRQGHHGTARRWFTLFWIPLIPLKVVGDYVGCDSCGKRFDPAVLQRPTTANLSEVLGNAIRVLTAMVVRTGDAASTQMRAAAVDDVRVVVPGYTDDTLTTDMDAIDLAQAEHYVHPLADGLETAGKERLLSDLCRVALAGGTITVLQRQLIDVVGRGMGLTPAHVAGIVSSAGPPPTTTAPSAQPSIEPGPSPDEP